VTSWAVTPCVHVYPVADLVEHEMSPTCPCLPKVQEGTSDGGPMLLFKHSALDGRPQERPV
jgi:hypothetical protein